MVVILFRVVVDDALLFAGVPVALLAVVTLLMLILTFTIFTFVTMPILVAVSVFLSVLAILAISFLVLVFVLLFAPLFFQCFQVIVEIVFAHDRTVDCSIPFVAVDLFFHLQPTAVARYLAALSEQR